MGNIKEINIKNRTYYFFDDMIHITTFGPNLLKIDKKPYKNIDVYYIGYITMKDSGYVKFKSVNPLYLIISEVDKHFELKNGNKYLILDSTNKNKVVLKEYTQLRDGIKNYAECNFIEKINNKLGEYRKKILKIKFNSHDTFPLNKILKLQNITIIIRSVFHRIDISEGIDVNKTNASKECNICHYWYFKDIGFKYELYLCNGCHGLMQKAMKHGITEFTFGT